MKKMAEQNKKSSIPLVLQSFGLQQYNKTSNVSSRMKSNPKKNQTVIHPTHYIEESQGLTCQTSRKRLEIDDRAISEHYENLEKILINENLNLKQQNCYLTSEVRKALRRQEKLKEEVKSLNSRLKICSEEINQIQTEYTNSKNLIQKQMSYLSTGLKSSNAYQLKNMVWRYIDEISNHFKFQIDYHFPFQEYSLQERQDNQQSKSEIDNQIELLTKKLEKLLHEETGQNRAPAVRKECIEISKQLKQLKEKSRIMSNQTIPHNQMSELVRGTRPSLPVQSSQSRERKFLLRSDSIKKEMEEGNKFSTQVYSKITRRKSINRQNKLSKGNSRVETPMMVSPSGSDHRLK